MSHSKTVFHVRREFDPDEGHNDASWLLPAALRRSCGTSQPAEPVVYQTHNASVREQSGVSAESRFHKSNKLRLSREEAESVQADGCWGGPDRPGATSGFSSGPDVVWIQISGHKAAFVWMLTSLNHRPRPFTRLRTSSSTLLRQRANRNQRWRITPRSHMAAVKR